MSTESIDPVTPELAPAPTTEQVLSALQQAQFQVEIAAAILRERGIDYRTGQPIEQSTYTPGPADSVTTDHEVPA